jgi:hypothetical protein
MELTLDKTPYKIGTDRKGRKGEIGRTANSLYITKPDTKSASASGFSTKSALQAETKQRVASKADRVYRDFTASFTPFPIKPDRNCVYISGPSGAGKSYLAAQFIAEYIHRYPKNDVYVFQPTETPDPAFEPLIELMKHDENSSDDESLAEEWDQSWSNDQSRKKPKKGSMYIIPLNMVRDKLRSGEMEDFTAEQFKNSCVLFDDFLSITDKATIKYSADLKHMLLETGRKLKVTVVCTSHLLANATSTKDMITESNMISFFPGNSDKNTRYFLTSYIGLDKNQLETIMNLPATSGARWVMIGLWPTRYVVWEHGAYLL